uniref:Uncharacterized protein n=1 Tax=Oncorhynchus kisutch TaxID=8019 RepID=A0A8C7K8U6_ONCKI
SRNRFVCVEGITHSQFGRKTLKYQVYEEQKVGTVIARLKEDVADVLVKLPSSVSLRFRAMQRGNLHQGSGRKRQQTRHQHQSDVPRGQRQGGRGLYLRGRSIGFLRGLSKSGRPRFRSERRGCV